MAVLSRKGRIERRRQQAARLRRPDLGRFYNVQLNGITPGAWRFRLQLIPGRGQRGTVVDHLVDTFDWTDAAAALSGNASLYRPDPNKPSSLPIAVGQMMRCDVRWKGAWLQLWEMGIQPYSVNLPDNTVDVPLADDLIRLDRGKRDWSFRKTKHRKKGYTAEEVTHAVARAAGLKVGQLAHATYRFDRLVAKNTTGLDVLRQAWQKEKDRTGRRFVIRIRAGKLEVIPLRRNNILYVFEKEIQTALLNMSQATNPATVLVGRGHIGKGKGARKVKYKAADRAVVRRFGRVQHEKDYGQVHSYADLRQQVKRDYAKALKITRTASITVPCVPFIRRGDGIQWKTREPGWHGSSSAVRDRSYVYTTNVQHTVSQDAQTTSLDLTQNDPFVTDALRLDAFQREQARKRRKKRSKKK